MIEKNSLPLFIEDVYDALRSLVQALGGAKPIAGRLWPHKPIAQAHRELLDALNRDNPRKFDPEEVLALLRMARESGYHSAKHWIDGELGYVATPTADPVVERDRLVEEMTRAADNLAKLQRDVEKLTRLQVVNKA